VNAYLLLPLTACVSSAMLATAILVRDAGHRMNRLGATLTLGSMVWSFCEVLWNTADDPAAALWLVRVSSLGWVAIGPIGLHLFRELVGHDGPRLRRAQPWLYGISALFFLLDLATPWVHTGVVRTSWGFGYEFGPAYPPFYAFTVGCLAGALSLGIRHFRESPSPSERSQASWLMLGIAVPLVVASLTDGLLPLAGFQPPRLGTIAFAFLGATIAWSITRYGYSLLAPGDFASEILDTLPEGVALLRLDGRVRTVNAGMARLTGLPPRELEHHPLAGWIHGLALEPDAELGEQECLLDSAEHGSIPVSVSTALLRDKRGVPLGLVLVARDLREVTSLRSRLVTSGRLAAVGQLAAGIAHEINNPIAFVSANLGALRGTLEAIAAKLPPGLEPELREPLRESQELIDESLDGVERVAAIVRDVKSFSHMGRGARGPVELQPLLDAVLRVAAPQLRRGGRVERLYGDVPPVLGDPQELKQVFLNLVINASHAVRGDEAIRIVTERAGDRVAVHVEDEGCGIAPEVIGSIFDPFFTTKRPGEGTGLGLSIAYQIVRNHGGELTVESELGRGTRFRVELPAAASA
jgi:signal transduction histidine kinase